MTNAQETPSRLDYDRTKFQIQKKFGGYIVTEALYSGPTLVSNHELGIIYTSHAEALRAVDSLVRRWKISSPNIAIEWSD
ncbi:MAG: hypothetical protein U0V70_08220 [Terriglobia bacterium]